MEAKVKSRRCAPRVVRSSTIECYWSAAQPRSLAWLLGALLLAGGCAGDKFGTRTQTWSEAGDSDYTGESVKADKKKLTAREYAARFPSSAECEIEARRVETFDERGGVALFKACLDRADFREIEPYVSTPWRALLTDEGSLTDLARIIANRGGWVADDLSVLQQRDVEVLALSQALEQPEQARGKVLIARVRYLEPRKGVPGQLVFEEATLTPDDALLEDEEATAAPVNEARFPTVLTGQRVLLELPDRKAPLRPGDELIVAAELLGVERVLNAELAEEQEWAVLRVLGEFTPETRFRS